MNSKKKSRKFLKYRELKPFIRMPSDICTMAKITADYILKLFE